MKQKQSEMSDWDSDSDDDLVIGPISPEVGKVAMPSTAELKANAENELDVTDTTEND